MFSLRIYFVLIKDKIHASQFEDLIGFLKQFKNCAASHLATTRPLQGLPKMEGLFRKKGGTRALLTKENEGLFLDQDILFWGKGKEKVFIMQIASSFYGMERGEDPFDRFPHLC